MSKQEVHFAAIGYEPLRMKPVHFSSVLSVVGTHANAG